MEVTLKLKHLFATLVTLAILGMMCACAGTQKSGTGGLDAAIQRASKDINKALSSGTKVALLNFTSDSDVLSEYVIEEMSIALVKSNKLAVVDRREIDYIRGETNLPISGEVSDEYAQEIGKLLGVRSVITGSLINMGENHRFRTKVINVNSAAIEALSSANVADDPQIQFLLSQGRASTQQTAASQGGAQSPEQTQLATPAAALPAYNIGDTGPAGGFIFYDKGSNSGGWRYLEAAPEDAEFQAIWSAHSTEVENTQNGIGNGKRNTQLIVDTFSKTSGELDTAAQKANDLVINGFDDWFLPSQSELNQMYKNLKQGNLGELKDQGYWSSTQNSYYHARYQEFDEGRMTYHQKSNNYYVRVIRQVDGPPGTGRNLADDDVAEGTSKKKQTKFAAWWASKAKSRIWPILGGLAVGGVVAYSIWSSVANR